MRVGIDNIMLVHGRWVKAHAYLPIISFLFLGALGESCKTRSISAISPNVALASASGLQRVARCASLAPPTHSHETTLVILSG